MCPPSFVWRKGQDILGTYAKHDLLKDLPYMKPTLVCFEDADRDAMRCLLSS